MVAFSVGWVSESLGTQVCTQNMIVPHCFNVQEAWWWFGLTSLPWAELNLKWHHIPQGCVQLSFLCLQGWGSDSLSGQLSLSNQACCGEVFTSCLTRISCSAAGCFLSVFHCAAWVCLCSHSLHSWRQQSDKQIPSLAFCSPGQKGTWSESAV